MQEGFEGRKERGSHVMILIKMLKTKQNVYIIADVYGREYERTALPATEGGCNRTFPYRPEKEATSPTL